MEDFLSNQLALIELDSLHTQMTKEIIIKNAKPIALHIMHINIAYAKSHTPYKAFKRLNNDITPYLWHKPFNIIKENIQSCVTADDIIGELMENEREQDSDCSLDSDDEHDYDALCNWLGKKHNYYKIYNDICGESLDKNDYKPLTQSDTVKIFKQIQSKIAKFQFSKKDIENDKYMKKIQRETNDNDKSHK